MKLSFSTNHILLSYTFLLCSLTSTIEPSAACQPQASRYCGQYERPAFSALEAHRGLVERDRVLDSWPQA